MRFEYLELSLIICSFTDKTFPRLYTSEFRGHSQGVGYGDGGPCPSSHELDDALAKTGRIFGGLINDIKEIALNI